MNLNMKHRYCKDTSKTIVCSQSLLLHTIVSKSTLSLIEEEEFWFLDFMKEILRFRFNH